MNELFNFSRFSRLFVKHTVEHFRTYLMAMGILVGFLVMSGAFLFFVAPGALDPGFQTGAFAIVLFVAGGLFTSSIFADYGNRNKAIPTLTLPASGFEKFLVAWLWSYPIFLVVYIVVFYLAIWGLSELQSSVYGQPIRFFRLRQDPMTVVWVLFTEVHALAFFGAIFFKSLQFIRTGFTFFVALLLTLLLNTIFLKILTGAQVIKVAIPFGFLNFAAKGREYQMSLDEKTSLLILGLILIVALGTWVAAYYRLKEKRV